MATVGIIGGGPAGLGLAHYLGSRGLDVSLFEAASELGGLARSFQFGDITIERYYHFICGSDNHYFEVLEEIGAQDLLRWKPTRMGFFYQGKLYPFSSALDLLRFRGVSFSSRVRYGLSTLFVSRIRNWKQLDKKPAEQWLVSLLGQETYDATWFPLLSMKFPGIHQQISAAWIWHRVHRVASSRKTLFHQEKLGYLSGGTQALIDSITNSESTSKLQIFTNTAVEQILTDGKRATGVKTASGEEHLFDYVVSAVPLPAFLRMAPYELAPQYFRQLEAIDFIGVVCVILRLKHPLTENFWTNVNDSRIPFNGFIEYSNLNPLTPDGSTIAYVPYYLPKTDERFRYSDQHLIDECLESLSLVNPAFRHEDVLDWAISRDPYAQVVCPAGFAETVPGHKTPIDRLFLIESSQLYPSDRTVSGTLELAKNVADLIGKSEGIQE